MQENLAKDSKFAFVVCLLLLQTDMTSKKRYRCWFWKESGKIKVKDKNALKIK